MKNKYLIIGLIFLVISGIIIYSAKITILLFPTQETELRGKLEYEGLTKNVVIMQEITAEKDYLAAVDIAMRSYGMNHLNNYSLLVLNADYQLLYVHSENMDRRSLYRNFKFAKKIHVGKGNKVILCLFTLTGDRESGLAVPRIATGKSGKLSVKQVVNGDVIETLKGNGQTFFLQGSICLRTYESNDGTINWFKIFLLFITGLMTLLIVFAEKVYAFVVRLSFAPEKIYVALALIFGAALVFLTPPLQSPDEHDHLNRSYQLSEFNIFQNESTVPVSLIKLFDTFEGMNFNAQKKTSINEILSQRNVELNPHVRTAIFARTFIFPYFPQALGIFIGKAWGCSPVTLLYMGRIFNLLFSIMLIYFAIRTIPFFKWIFFLLGLMPMTLSLFASLSKDAMVIGIAFLLIALILSFAYDQQKKMSTKDLIILFVASFLLATSRSVYTILIGMFLLIPIDKIGSIKRFILIFISLIITVLLATQIESLKPLFQSKALTSMQSNTSLVSSQDVLSAPTVEKTSIENFHRTDRVNPPEGINRKKQIHFILSNPVQYMEMLFNEVFIYKRPFYLDSFVGMLGWLNKPLPNWHVNFYLWTLIIAALLFSNKEIEVRLKNKIIIASLLITGVVLVESGLYLTWTPVGHNKIEGVQGRYFIPFAPLFFLLLYNTSLNKYLNVLLSSRKQKQAKNKKKFVTKQNSLEQNNRQVFFYNSFYLLTICFSVVSLLSTVYVVLAGYYIVLI